MVTLKNQACGDLSACCPINFPGPRRNYGLFFLALLFLLSGASTSSGQGVTRLDPDKSKRLEWWLDARFGMMIHWGAYAQAGGWWKGVYEGGYSEWLKFRGIPNEEYDSLIRDFNPIDFNATQWVQTAKNAGMKYLVFTAKHHDGFAMYNSAISDYDIVDRTRFGRDPVGELATACQKAGIKFGVYYSVDRDWHHPDAACDDRYRQCNFWDYPENRSGAMDRWHNKYFKNYAVKQITELVSQYPIDILWFDGIGLKTPEEVALLDSIIHKHRPDCLINSRISNFVDSEAGDYGSKGDNETPGGYQAGGWENPGTLGFSYGYSERDSFMTARQAVHNLIEIVSKGGNYLLNVGPNGKGIIIPEATAILHEMGTWLKKYGASIYGADGIPYEPPEGIRITQKPHQLFVHVLNPDLQSIQLSDTDGVLEHYLGSVQWVYRLADPSKTPMNYEIREGILSIDLNRESGQKSPNPYSEVLVVSDLEPPKTLSLWKGKAPTGDGAYSTDNPIITVHQAPKPNGAAVVICPGGGYGYLVKGPEGHQIAGWLNEQGVTGIVLEYRLPKGNYQLPLLDVQQAIRTVRFHAEDWKIDPEKIGIMGFSAGGHLASTAATHFDTGNPKASDPLARLSCRPDFGILIYPVVSMGKYTHAGSRDNLLGPEAGKRLRKKFSNERQVSKQTPPLFLAHALDDGLVPPENSRMLYKALRKHQVPAHYLELPSGGHGLDGYSGPMWETWKTESLRWMDSLGIIPGRDSLQEALGWLEKEADRIIRASKRTMADGTAAFPPQVGLGYEAFWLRDYAYTLEGSINSYTDQELKAACRLFVKNIREDGAGVDCIRFDGTPIYQPGFGSMGTNPVADGSQFTVDVAWHTWNKTRDSLLLLEILDPLIKTMRAVPRNPESNLVHIRSDLEYDRCPYGFTDVTRKQGDILFCSLLYVQACRQLSGLLKAGNRESESLDWAIQALSVANSIRETFWDASMGLFRAATVKCREHDIWGSAFAVYLGVADAKQSLKIATYFRDHYSELVQDGQIRHLPGGVYWEQACAPDSYQNGAFWATPAGWFAYALSLKDRNLANQILLDLVQAFQRDGACEWVFGDRKVLPDYLASAALPLDGFKNMLLNNN